ncbi:MAG: hypothetical protein WEB85_10560 [Dongiaceae bacterium]
MTRETRSRDHIIANSWYPETTPASVQRWTVFACKKCNHELGIIEQEMFIRLGLCLDPNAPGANEIVSRALAALDPQLATNAQEAEKRRQVRHRISKDVEELPELPGIGVLPAFKANWDLGSRTGIRIDPQQLHRVVQKWVKGLHFRITERLIPDWDSINVRHITAETEAHAFREIEPYAMKYNKGPGIQVLQFSASENGQNATIYRFVIWDQYRVHATIFEDDASGT